MMPTQSAELERLKRADCFDCVRADCPKSGKFSQACERWMLGGNIKTASALWRPEISEYPVQ